MLVQIFEEQVRRTPKKTAVEFLGKSYSYQELNNIANLIAAQLLNDYGLSQQTVGILLNHGVEMIAAMFGVLKSNNIYLPLDVTYPENRLSYMLQHSNTQVVLTDETNYELAVRIVRQAGGSIEVLNLDTVKKDQVQANLDIYISPDQLAYILYTSGSTAKPKGVMQTLRNVNHFIECYRENLQITDNDRLTLFSSFSHDAAVMDIFGALLTGATLYPLDIRKEVNLSNLASWLKVKGITIWHSVPTLYRYFTNTIEAEVELPDLRMIVLGGEALRRRDIEVFQSLFHHAILYNLYGQTETSYNAGEFFTPDQTFEKITLGQVVSDTDIFVVDQDGAMVDPLETGEIVIASRFISPGYWQDAEMSNQVFLKNETYGGIYRTGDLGRVLLDGRIEFAGRKDFQLKIRGFRVEPGEIETVLLTHETVQETVVMAYENKRGDYNLCAYIVSNSSISPNELREYLFKELPEYMVPAHYVFLEHLPITPNGKIDRKALPVPQVKRDHEVKFIAPKNDLEKLIAELWENELEVNKVGVEDNFFDLGGNSLEIILVNGKLNKLLQLEIPVVKMFEFPTVSSLARYVSQLLKGESSKKEEHKPVKKVSESLQEKDIAVIGLAGRFPGAKNVKQFWENLKNGIESISFFSIEELQEAGIEPDLFKNPDYIKAKGVLDDLEYFDADFFDYLPADAKLMDPQTRIFHECVWDALEDAGYNSASYPGLIGLFAGAASNLQWEALSLLSKSTDMAGQFSAKQLYDKDFLSTRISYKLNLKGPSYVVQTACSTSLAAIDLGCQSLLAGNCDIALAGGISILLPKKAGYLYQEGMIFSKDGHCRAFDSAASGTVAGDGCGVVVLKRLKDALSDGDNIYAVIKGSASNNDGLRKVGFTAPSVEGQVEVIRTAHTLAGVTAEGISYVETHGTGTALGDPIEVESLKQAFATQEKGYCALGSVKTNIGHLGIAAGVAGFIKTVLALKEQVIPPTLNFTSPNAKIDFLQSPFYINDKLTDWKSSDAVRRAGISAFGIGGTNIHMILEEAPIREKKVESESEALIIYSARTEKALTKVQENLCTYVQENNYNLADLAYTLQMGRKAFKYRRAAVVHSKDELLALLLGQDRVSGCVEHRNQSVIFALTGELQHAFEIGKALYAHCPQMRLELEKCLTIASTVVEMDLQTLLHEDCYADDSTLLRMNARKNEIQGLVHFCIQYACVTTLLKLQIIPDALFGYGVDQLVLGCIADVFQLEDGLRLTALAVRQDNMAQNQLRDYLLSIPLNRPTFSFNSFLTGQLIIPDEATDPEYWRTCVDVNHPFAKEVVEDIQELEPVVLQIGFGEVSLSAEFAGTLDVIRLFSTDSSDVSFKEEDFLTAIGQLWVRGFAIDWQEMNRGKSVHRISLPTYPFERQRFWFDDENLNRLLNMNTTTHLTQNLSKGTEQPKDFSEWFYTPVWERSMPVQKSLASGLPWLVFVGESEFASKLLRELKDIHPNLIIVKMGNSFSRLNDTTYQINPTVETDYDVLFVSLKTLKRVPERIIHLWSIESSSGTVMERLPKMKDVGFYSLINVAKASGKVGILDAMEINVVSSNMQEVLGGDLICPEKALILGAVRNIPMEYLNINCRSIDIELSEGGVKREERVIKSLLAELTSDSVDLIVAYRGNYRWVQNWQMSRLEKEPVLSRLKERGTYLITGGTGGIGLAIAEYIAKTVHANLILSGRSVFPPRESWDELISTETDRELVVKIQQIREIERLGSKVMICQADLANQAEMQKLISDIQANYGQIHGVVHSAGIPDYAGAIQRIERNEVEKIFAAKVDGTLILCELLRDSELDFFILCSSLWSILPSFGQVGYCAANSFMDAYAHFLTNNFGICATSINWDTWQEVGMSVKTVQQLQLENDIVAGREKLKQGLRTEEGMEAFQRILSGDLAQVVVSSRDLNARLSDIDAYKTEGKHKLFGDAELPMVQQGLRRAVTREEVQEALKEMWKETLTLATVELTDDFFELGGDSLKAITFTAKINKEWNVKVPLEEVFKHSTLEALAQYILNALGEKTEQSGISDGAIFIDRKTDVLNLHRPFPLTGVQKAYLVGRSEQYDLGGVSTHSYSEFQQEVDIERLNRSFNQVIQRHVMLRAIVLEDGQQMILSDIPEYQIEVTDLRCQTLSEQEKRILHERERMSHHVFKTEQWPLFEIKAFRLTDELYHFCVGFDLLILDASSFELLSRDLLYFYANPESNLPELEFTFRDYVLAYEQLKGSEQYVIDKEYWLSRLPDFPLAPALPLKCQPAEVKKPHFQRLKQIFSQKEMAKLRELAAENNLTVSALLCTVFAQVLGYWSNQTKFALNLSVFNRYPFHRDVNKLIGDFTSIILLDITLKPATSLIDKAKAVQNNLLEALEHRLYDGVEFIREISRYNELGTQAVMPIVFTSTIGNREVIVSEEKIKLVGSLTGISQTSQVFLDNKVSEVEGELIILWDYVADLFDEAIISQMFAQYTGTLSALIENKEYKIGPSQADLWAIEKYNRTEEEIPLLTLDRLFSQQVKRIPDQLAIQEGERSITFAELDRKSSQVAYYLQEKGVKQGDFIGVITSRTIETIINLVGIIKVGAAYVPIDPEYPTERKKYIEENSNCRLILKSQLCTEAELDYYPGNGTWAKNSPEDLAYVIYTSGSTGRPKGVMITHGAVCNTIIDINQKFNVTTHDKIIGISSMCFDLSVYDIFGALSTGATLVLIEDQRDAKALIRTVEDYGITFWNSVPAIMDMALEHLQLNEINISGTSLRVVLLSGDWIPLKLPPKIRQYYPHAEVISLGGATEASIWSIYYPIHTVEKNWKSIPYGMPLANQKFYVLDIEQEFCPVGVRGELYIGGVGVAAGYLNDLEKTANAFIDHPQLGRIYRTGDYGKLTSKGYIEFLGRVDSQVKIRGYRIELGEIEARLMEYPVVRNAVVIDRINNYGKRYLCAYIVSDEHWTVADLRKHLIETLPEYMVPAYFVKLAEIPLTPNGKVDRKALPEPEESRNLEDTYCAPQNVIEEQLVGIWQELLVLDEIGIKDNFFELGGDSLKIQHLANRIARYFAVEMPLKKIFMNPTIVQIAAYIIEQQGLSKAMPENFKYADKDANIAAANLPFPLTNIQKAYLVGRSDQFDLGGVSTHSYAEFKRRIDLERLEKSFNRLIKRHGMLRAIILDNGTQQILAEVPPYQIAVEDLRHFLANDQETRIFEERERMSHHVFKTDQWPLFEIKAFHLAEDVYYFCVGFDLLILDASSSRILGKEFLAFFQNPDLEIDKLEFTFRDYVMAYEELKGSAHYQRDKMYWLEKLPEFPSAPALPLKCNPADVEKPHFQRKERWFSRIASVGLKEFAKSNGMTISVILCTAYAQVLSYWSGQSQLAINVSLFNRYPFHPDVEKIIGDFTSVILLGLSLPANQGFVEQARSLQEVLIEALEHRLYDGVELIREIARYNNLGTQAAMPVVFTSIIGNQDEAVNLDEIAPGEEQLSGASMGISQTSQVFLDNQVSEVDGQIKIVWDYVADLFSPDIIEQMFTQYIGILNGLIHGQEFILCPSTDDLLMIEEYNRTNEEIPPTTLDRLFSVQVRRTPEQIAVQEKGKMLTFAELDKKSSQVACYLQEQGIEKGDFVGLLASRRSETIINVMGILKVGAVYVPIDPEYPEERKNYLLKNSNCKMVITHKLYEEAGLCHYPEDSEWEKNKPEDLAYVIYTSGSTGKPKGVMITHGAVCNTIIDINRKFNVTSTDKIMGISSMCFDLSVYDIFGALSTGATLVLIEDQRDAYALVRTVEECGITFWNSVPAIMDMTLEHCFMSGVLTADGISTSLRVVLLSGDWIPLKLPEKIQKYFPNAEVISLGGATEASIWSIYHPVQSVEANWRSIPYGKPLANQKFYVLDTEQRLCPVGVRGELYIGGIGVASGYLNDQEKTQNAFFEHPELGRLYRTGDYGKLTDRGWIEFLGRIDSQVKIRGYRIELGEIETRLMEYPGVRNAVVIDRVSEIGKKYLCAYLVSEMEWTVTDLRKHLSETLPEYMVPTYFVSIEAVPLTPNGKVDRRALPEPLESRNIDDIYCAPRNAVEERLVHIWQELLSAEVIGVEDNFFDLGGDSLKIQHLVNAIVKEFNVQLKLRDIFLQPTVAQIAERIGSGATDFASFKNTINHTEHVSASDRYYWSPIMHWQKEADQIRIEDVLYDGIANTVFPDIYFLTQKGMTLEELTNQFPTVDSTKLQGFLTELVNNRVLVNSILPLSEVVAPQNKLYVSAYGEEIYYDAVAYNRFKYDQLNRTYNYHAIRSIQLQDDIEFDSMLSERKSYREFDEKALIRFASFTHLISTFKQIREDEQIRYYYASAGGLYPIDIYIYVKANRVEDIAEGLYYYSPQENSLILINDTAKITGNAYGYGNKAIFNSAAFSIYMIYNADVSMPKYGAMGYPYACVDTGIMVSTLTQVAEAQGIGLCSIGTMNFDSIRNFFNLKPTQLFIHAIELGLKSDVLANSHISHHEYIIPVIAEQDYYPLTPAQQRMYILHQFNVTSTSYNNPTVVCLEGRLDYEKIQEIFHRLIERHDALRTSFEVIKGETVQRVHKNVEFKIEFSESNESQTLQVIKAFIRPFDLAKAPLFRVGLIKLSEERHLLMFDLHHIVSDGTSILVLIREFGQLYHGEELAPLRIQYKDFAAWQWKMLADETEMKAQAEYWLDQFSDSIPVLEFPWDYQRPVVQNFEGMTVDFALDNELTEQLHEFAKKNNATLFMVLLAGFNTLLHRYSGQEDIVVGSPIAGRPHADLRYIVGMFVNTLALRSYPEGKKTFEQYLAEVKEICLKAYENQDYQFEQLVSKLDIPRDMSRNPLFDTMFVLQNMDIYGGQLADIHILPFEYDNQVAKFDLTLTGTEVQGRLVFNLQYCTRLFEEETIQRLIRHFVNILQAIVKTPEARLSELAMLSAAEQHQMIVEYNATDAQISDVKLLHQLFEEQTMLTPERIAVEISHMCLTYRELNERVNMLAWELIKRGVVQDQIVGLLMERSVEMLVSLLAILKAGGAYLPIDPEYPIERIEYMLQDSETVLLLSTPTVLTATGLPYQEYGWLQCIDVTDPNVYTKDSLNPQIEVESTNLAYVIYTSGSTGKPKGVLVEHKGVVNYLNWAKKMYIDSGECNMPLYSSLSFDLTVTSIYLPLITGNRVVIYDDEEKELLIQKIIRDNRVQIVKLTPAHLQLVKELDITESNIKRFIVGGEDLKVELAKTIEEKFAGKVEIYNEYGPTETVVGCMIHRFNALQDVRVSVPIGVPAENVQVYLLDAYLQPVAYGVSGEIYIAGMGVARGYVKQAGLTVEKFIENPYQRNTKMYKTGDMARRLANDELEYIGRKDNQVKVRGYRIELGEIASVLLKLSGVKEAVVIARKDHVSDTYLCAYLSFEHAAKIHEAELKSSLALELPEYMLPAYFVTLERMPLTSNGKIDRQALMKYELRISNSTTYVAPTTQIESRLVEMWIELLKVEQVGIDDNFFKLGGHSLKATQMLLKVQKEFSVDVPLRQVFSHGTIRELARYITESQKISYAAIEPQSVQEYYPVSSAQKRMYIINQLSGGIEYNLPQVVRLNEWPDKDRFQQALNALLKRHESLRTSFHLVDGEPVQRIHPTLKCLIRERRVAKADFENAIQHMIQPFDLAVAPLLKVELVQVEDEFLLMLDIHHIIADGMSLDILISEFLTLYAGSELPELRIQYKDFAVWQNQMFASALMKQQETFWLKTFAAEIPILHLPTDFQRPAQKDFTGEQYEFTFSEELTIELHNLANQQGATLFMVLLAGVNILLSKYSGQEDIVVGSPIAGRPHFDLRNMIGMFVNTLAMRNQPVGDLTFISFLAQVKENALKAYENQDYPFEMLVDHLQLERRLNRNPLFDVMFVLQNAIERIEKSDAGLEYTPYLYKNKITRFDLTFNVHEDQKKLVWNLQYATSLFAEATITRMVGHLYQIFTEIVHNPVLRLQEIQMLSFEEQRILTLDWNGTDVEYPTDLTLFQMFTEQVEKTPESIAVSIGETDLTYRELAKRASRLASTLRKKGVKSNTIVALLTERSVEMVSGILGIMLAGGAYLPLNVDYPEERLRYILKDSNTNFLVAQPQLLNRQIVPANCEIIKLESIEDDSEYELNDVARPTDLAYIIYTSGTTGEPKGVMVEHASIVNTIWWRKHEYDLGVHDRVLQLFSYSFDGFLTSFFTPLVSGAESVLLTELEAKDVEEIRHVISTKEITHFIVVPSLYAVLLDSLAQEDAKSLSVITLAGEMISERLIAETVKRLPQVELVNEYGLTEGSVASTCLRNLQLESKISIGRPICNTQAYVVDKYGQLVSVGVTGELWIGGQGVAKGYLNQPDLTKERFISASFAQGKRIYQTGDLVRWRSDGKLEYIGRLDQQLKIRGYRIEPAEIEKQILAEPGIKAAHVIDQEDSDGKYLIGYFVAEEPIELMQLRRALAEKLPDYLIPAHLIQLEQIPLSANGKLDRNALLTPAQNQRGKRVIVKPGNAIEEVLGQLWATVLEIDGAMIGIDDAFFDLGGNSLKLIKLNGLVNERFGTKLKIANYFEMTTIRQLGEYLSQTVEISADDEIGEYVL